jgi:hypothetical protein
MGPIILILEPRREVASALEDLITSAHYTPVVIQHLERLADLEETPAAIIVRIAFEGLVPAHAAIEKLPANRPPVLAIAWNDEEAAEAERLRCDVVLRPPRGVSRLCEALKSMVNGPRDVYGNRNIRPGLTGDRRP